MPKVSIVIPTYNRSAYLQKAIRNVLDQSFSDIEVIVVDDGSTDNTMEVLRQFGGRIKYISQVNQGVAAARNSGLKMASGVFIAFLDSDDEWDKDFILKMVYCLENTNCYWGICDNYRVVIDVNEKEMSREHQKRTLMLNSDEFYRTLLERDIVGGPSKGLFRKKVLEKIGGYDIQLSVREDWDLWIRLAALKLKVGHVEEPLYTYFIRQNSLTKTNRAQGIKATLKLLDKHRRVAYRLSYQYRKIYGEIIWDLARDAIFDLKDYKLCIYCMFKSISCDLNLLRLVRLIKISLRKKV